jgi:hypothetical protein
MLSPAHADAYNGAYGVVDCSKSGSFSISNNVLVQDNDCSGTASIPEGVTRIKEYTFKNSNTLISVIIPSSVQSIEREAFSRARELKSVTFLGHVNRFGFSTTAFEGVAAGAKAYISSCATGFANVGEQWFGLVVEIGVYCLTYNASGGTGSTTTGFVAGGSVLAPAQPTKNCIFDGWSATRDGLKEEFPYTPGVLSDTTLYARWKTCTYRVTVIAGSKPAINSFTYVFGKSIADPGVPRPRNGRYFAGWSITGHRSSVINFPYTPQVEGHVVLRAIWNRSLRARATIKPTVTGKAKATKKGTNKLTAKKGSWTGTPTPAISYKWYSCTAQVKSVSATIPKTCKTIPYATKPTLTVTKSFKGKYLAVAVTGKVTGTRATRWLSKSTVKVK